MASPFEVEDELEMEDAAADSCDYDGLFDEEDFIALGINPSAPTLAKPGSEDKVQMLAARYAAGLPLWHDKDCYDHGPGELNEAGEDEEEELELLD